MPENDQSTDLLYRPAAGFVVHRVAATPEHLPPVWAWCKVEDGVVGYTSITFTAADGHTPVDPPSGRLVLGDVITRVFC